MAGMHRVALARCFVAVLGTALLCAAENAFAGGRLPCEEARVFSDAAVNVLVLPYRYEAKIRFDERSAGARLVALIQQETLFSMLKYGSVGATELISERGELCDVRDVLSRIIRENTLRAGRGLAMIWGRIYEEESQLYVQSYIRFMRRDEQETIRIDLSAPGNQTLQFIASLPAQAAAMMPRRLTRKDLAEIERRSAETLILRREPRDNAPGKSLQASTSEPLTYGVVGVKGEWMQIRSYVSGETGWVRARIENEGWALRRFLPELAYLDGVIAYLRLRTAPRVPLTNDPKRVYGWMQSAFTNFETAVGKDAVPEATGLAKAMMGLVVWTQPALAAGADARSRGAQLFQEAVERMPASPDARVLAAVTSPLLTQGPKANKESLAKIDQGLLGAVAVDPHSASALENLERLYQFASRNASLAPYGSEELQARLAAIKTAGSQPGTR